MTTRPSHLALAFMLAGASLPAPATSAPGAGARVAQLSAAAGAVTIVRAATGAVDEARQDGPRVIGGSVHAGDLVRTDQGGTATLTFSDGTTLDIKETTSLTVTELDLHAIATAVGATKPTLRTVRVLAGELVANVIASPQVATQFETPGGLVSIPDPQVPSPATAPGKDPAPARSGATVRIAVGQEGAQ